MIRVLDELLWVLRREGFVIATPQAVAALRATALVGVEDRATLRAAIASAIVTRSADRARFDEVFDGFFAARRGHAGDLWSRLRAQGFSDAELSALRDMLDAAAMQSGSSFEARALAPLLGAEHDLDHLLRAAGIARVLAPATSPLTAGFYAHEVMKRAGVPHVARAITRIRDALRDALGDERGGALADALSQELDHLKRRVRAHVDETVARRSAEPSGDAKSAIDKPFTSLDERERAEVRLAVRRLAERLRGGERVRRRHALRGRLDPRRTIRRSAATGGVPFAPARKKRRRDKPKLMILCDVSDSVRAASLFMLELVHAAQELFSGTRSFVFVSEIAETTALFGERSPELALAHLYGGGVVPLAHNSNYGRALRAFEASAGRAVDRRTTIVILGDGRTNFFADEAAIVARLRDKARAIVWICPESPSSWGMGDSAMTRYAAASSRVITARTARELEDAARRIASLR